MLWDTAGQEEFDAITKAYYRGENTMFGSWLGLEPVFKIFSYFWIKNFSNSLCLQSMFSSPFSVCECISPLCTVFSMIKCLFIQYCPLKKSIDQNKANVCAETPTYFKQSNSKSNLICFMWWPIFDPICSLKITEGSCSGVLGGNSGCDW